jgi:tetratricopeptide (TPR) repeat protein
MHKGDRINWQKLHDESLRLFQEEPQDEPGIALSLTSKAWVHQTKGEYDYVKSLREKSVEIYRKLGFKTGLAWSLKDLGDSLTDLGSDITTDNYVTARSRLRESLKIADELEDKWLTCEVLVVFGDLERFCGNYEKAAARYKKSKSLADKLDAKVDIAWACHGLGYVMLRQGYSSEAYEHFRRSVTLFQAVGETFGVVKCLFGFATEEAQGSPDSLERAVQLFSAAEHQLHELDSVLAPIEWREYQDSLSLVKTRINKEEFEAAWTRGNAMKTLEEAVEYALGMRSLDGFAEQGLGRKKTKGNSKAAGEKWHLTKPHAVLMK